MTRAFILPASIAVFTVTGLGCKTTATPDSSPLRAGAVGQAGPEDIGKDIGEERALAALGDWLELNARLTNGTYYVAEVPPSDDAAAATTNPSHTTQVAQESEALRLIIERSTDLPVGRGGEDDEQAVVDATTLRLYQDLVAAARITAAQARSNIAGVQAAVDRLRLQAASGTAPLRHWEHELSQAQNAAAERAARLLLAEAELTIMQARLSQPPRPADEAQGMLRRNEALQQLAATTLNAAKARLAYYQQRRDDSEPSRDDAEDEVKRAEATLLIANADLARIRAGNQ